MNEVAANAVPNAIQSAGYVRVAASLATLYQVMESYDLETLYFLVNIAVSAIERVPDNDALQVLEELLDFYDLTPSWCLQRIQRVLLVVGCYRRPRTEKAKFSGSGLTCSRLRKNKSYHCSEKVRLRLH